MGHFRRIVVFVFFVNFCFGQSPGEDKPAFNFKLDYNVPESPAFSVLGANPTTVMRGSASQEVIVQLVNDIINSSGAKSGLALDFNPYFVFGGRLKSIKEYRDNPVKRILANTQLSMATVAKEEFPNDLFMSGGIRLTLFDTKDGLNDQELINDISDILQNENNGSLIDDLEMDLDTTTSILDIDFTEAFNASKERYKYKKGGSMSVGAAIASRAKDNSLALDSISRFKSQIWLAGQYDFGVGGLSINGMLMLESQNNLESSTNGMISGLAIRKYQGEFILSAEITYNSIQEGFGVGAYGELYSLDDLVIFASYSYKQNETTGMYEKIFQPGIKWRMGK